MNKIIYYIPRILTILLVVFFGLFIFEGFGMGFHWQDSLLHVCVTLIILGITITAWRSPKIGGWLFVFLGIFFGVFFHPFWWAGLILGGAPLVAGLLFLTEKSIN